MNICYFFFFFLGGGVGKHIADGFPQTQLPTKKWCRIGSGTLQSSSSFREKKNLFRALRLEFGAVRGGALTQKVEALGLVLRASP